jgi:copper chaperone CopZ
MKKIYKVSGMHCDSCATMIELDLEDAGIKNCKCSYKNGTLEIEGKHNLKKVNEIIKKAGYSLNQ